MLTRKVIIALMFVLLMVAGGVQAGGDAERGKTLAVDCADCHGDDGMGDEDIPTIAGMDAAEHAKALADFKSGARPDEDENMTDTVADLSEQDMADLAAYFATLPGQ
jgi:cytochrome c553